MGQPEHQTLYDFLSDQQKSALKALGVRRHLHRSEAPNPEADDQVIEILESWLLDDEQKQSLKANVTNHLRSGGRPVSQIYQNPSFFTKILTINVYMFKCTQRR
jgi:hypothetical protein